MAIEDFHCANYSAYYPYYDKKMANKFLSCVKCGFVSVIVAFSVSIAVCEIK